MDLHDKEQELFERWRVDIPGFVTDGAVDVEAYSGSSPKILFLLKEVNDPGPGGGGWCLRDFLRQGGRPETWTNVTRWVYGIRNLPAEVPWHIVSGVGIPEKQRCCQLRTVAAVNLKKTPGGHTTDMRSFWPVVHRDAEHLREQFNLYSADLVICCGSTVADAFDACIKPGTIEPLRSTARGVKYLEYRTCALPIDMRSFWPVVHRDAEHLREQFNLSSADLVICCGSTVADEPQQI